MKLWFTKKNKQPFIWLNRLITSATYSRAKKDIILSPQLQGVKERISLENLLIKTFYKILQSEKNLSLLKVENPKDKWDDLLDEYWNIIDKDKYNSSIRKSVSFLKQENEITSLSAILLKASAGGVVKEDLKVWGIDNTTKALSRLRTLKTTYSIEMLRENQRHTFGTVEFNIYKDVVMLEQLLGRAIDIDKCNVLQWIEYNKLANEMNKKK